IHLVFAFGGNVLIKFVDRRHGEPCIPCRIVRFYHFIERAGYRLRIGGGVSHTSSQKVERLVVDRKVACQREAGLPPPPTVFYNGCRVGTILAFGPQTVGILDGLGGGKFIDEAEDHACGGGGRKRRGP